MSGPTTLYSDQLHAKKYRGKGESFREAMNRIASALKDNDAHWRTLRDILLDMRFLPGGRIQSAIGATRSVTAYNCFVSGAIDDSFVEGSASIMDRAKEAAATMRMGGGIGYDFSGLRPRGSLVRKLQAQSSGPVSFMEIYDAVCRCIASSGHRRGAQMGVLRIDHPDIEEFIHAKQNNDHLTGFNISVAVTDEFMQALAADAQFDLRWEGQTYKTVSASALWESVMRSTWDWAEPGVLFIDTINRTNNLWYCEAISATNPCVSGDTPILTREGYFPIASTVGQQVDVWNGEDWSPVTPFSTGVNATLLIGFSDGSSLRVTPYHGFCIQKGWSRGGTQIRKTASELSIGDKLAKFELPIVHEGETYNIDAYSQGFFSGDGIRGARKSFVYEPKFCCLHRLSGSFSSPPSGPPRKCWYHGEMLDKDFVPVDGNLKYRLEWLAGLLDSDGTVTKDKNGSGFQISSVNKEFLLDVKLLLTTLGVSSKVVDGREESPRLMPDQKGGQKLYFCQGDFRLLIGNYQAATLVNLGLNLSRLNHDGQYPQRSASRFITVTSIEEHNSCETFCFTEPTRGMGVFNGLLTFNCGEQPLPPHGACLLGSFNLVKYLVEDLGKFHLDLDQLQADIEPAVRAMDNVIDIARYPLRAQELEAKRKRRMGLGITGLANALEACGHPYGSQSFLEMQEDIQQRIAHCSYLASSKLADEKGSFPEYRRDLYGSKGFVSTLNKEILGVISNFGIRNSHLTSIAPTGTISLCADNVSSGIEPVFSHKMTRTVMDFDGESTEEIWDYGLSELQVRGKTSEEVTIDEHLGVLLTAQHNVDSSVSKTLNVPESTSWDDFKNIYLRAYEGGAKGCTTYKVGGKREGVIKKVEDASCKIDPKTGVRSCDD